MGGRKLLFLFHKLILQGTALVLRYAHQASLRPVRNTRKYYGFVYCWTFPFVQTRLLHQKDRAIESMYLHHNSRVFSASIAPDVSWYMYVCFK